MRSSQPCCLCSLGWTAAPSRRSLSASSTSLAKVSFILVAPQVQVERLIMGDRGGVTGRAVYIRELLDKAQEALRRVTEESEDRYAELEADGLLDEVVKHAGLAAIIVQDLQARRTKVRGGGAGQRECSGWQWLLT